MTETLRVTVVVTGLDNSAQQPKPAAPKGFVRQSSDNSSPQAAQVDSAKPTPTTPASTASAHSVASPRSAGASQAMSGVANVSTNVHVQPVDYSQYHSSPLLRKAEEETQPPSPDMDDLLDVPAFLRRSEEKEAEEV